MSQELSRKLVLFPLGSVVSVTVCCQMINEVVAKGHLVRHQVQFKGVGTAGATGALAPTMLKRGGRGRKYLIAPAIICQVYQLVDSQL